MAVDPLNRIRYNHVGGNWEVLVNGVALVQAYKTSAEAYAALQAKLHPPQKS